MSKGATFVAAVVIAALAGGAIGAIAWTLSHQGLVTVSGGVIGAVGGLIGHRVATAFMQSMAADESIES